MVAQRRQISIGRDAARNSPVVRSWPRAASLSIGSFEVSRWRVRRLAQSAVFPQKPGPKPDRKAARRIAHAARRRARGAKWEELYQGFIPDYGKLNPVTRSDADDGFRRKVNKYLQSHRRLREGR